jgi:proteic killer suppression protein
MEIASIRHKALRRFAEDGNAKGLIEPLRLRRMLSYIAMVRKFEEFSVPPNFGFHALTGDRSGTFAMTVTKNWRLTFSLVDEMTVGNLDLEDYH